MSPPVNQSCATCTFFVNGGCHRNAPQEGSYWTNVLGTDWCGEWSDVPAVDSPEYSDFACTIGASSGPLTSASVISARWLQIGSFVTFTIHARITTNGPGGGTLQFNIPTLAAYDVAIAGMRNGNLALMGFILNNTNTLSVTDTAGLYPGLDASDYYLTGVLEQG